MNRSSIMKRHSGWALALVLAASAAGPACSSGSKSSTASTSSSETTVATEPTTASSTNQSTSSTSATTLPSETAGLIGRQPRRLPAFADFAGVPLLGDSPAYQGPATPHSLDDVQMTDFARQTIDADAQLESLISTNGFAITEQSARFFYDIYEQSSYNDETLFITTDTAYNAWHLVFSKILRDTEEQRLEPALATFLDRMVTAARTQNDSLAGTPLAEPAARVVAYYEAAATLLGLDVGGISPRAQQEVGLAIDASDATTSPITGYQECQLPESFKNCVDYTQFLPRGHYTTTETLQRYFRAMSVLGQEAFYTSDSESLRVGLLATRLVTSDPVASDLWQQIYDATSFFVGVADDFTPAEAQQAATATLATGLDDASALADDAVVTDIGEKLTAMRSVAIDPENASVRVMGSRLVLDSYILDQLSWPNVGTEEKPRTHPSPLDLASSFGSPLADQIQTESGQPEYANYTTQLAKTRALISDQTPSDWAGTVYNAWLYALEPQFTERSIAYPDFMQTDAWAAKSQQTGFGSYTELKHDTILYAKQGTAGEGEGPEPPPYVPHHWVEPDPVTFGRLAAVAQLTRDGLDQRDLLSEDTTALLDSYIELTSWLRGIASDELAAKVTSTADNDRLGQIGRELELLWFESSDLSQTLGQVPANEDDAALVADIFRSSFEFLELGVATPNAMFVVVPDGSGHFQLATGAVYSYYEFWQPVTQPRLTDEEWRNMLATGTAPDRPEWVTGIIAT